MYLRSGLLFFEPPEPRSPSELPFAATAATPLASSTHVSLGIAACFVSCLSGGGGGGCKGLASSAAAATTVVCTVVASPPGATDEATIFGSVCLRRHPRFLGDGGDAPSMGSGCLRGRPGPRFGRVAAAVAVVVLLLAFSS